MSMTTNNALTSIAALDPNQVILLYCKVLTVNVELLEFNAENEKAFMDLPPKQCAQIAINLSQQVRERSSD